MNESVKNSVSDIVSDSVSESTNESMSGSMGGYAYISVEGDFSKLSKWKISLRPRLGEVKHIPSVFGCVFRIHDLHRDCPGRVVTTFDGIVEVSCLVVWVCGTSFIPAQVLDTLVRPHVNLDVFERSIGGDHLESMS